MTRPAIAALPLLLLLACPTGGGDDDASADDDDASADDDDASVDDDDTSADDDDSSPGANGDEVPERAPDETWAGDLSDGATMDLDWADDSSVACFIGTENKNFSGNHVLYDRIAGPGMNVFFRVTPSPDLDVSLYAMRLGENDTSWPPDVINAPCESSYDAQYDNNPGWSEAVELSGSGTYRIVVGVAGANGAADGAFTVDYWDESGG